MEVLVNFEGYKNAVKMTPVADMNDLYELKEGLAITINNKFSGVFMGIEDDDIMLKSFSNKTTIGINKYKVNNAWVELEEN